MGKYESVDYVKVEFEGTGGLPGEWMWVRVDHCDEKRRLLFGTLDNVLTSVAKCFGIDRLVTTMPAIAWKQPFGAATGSSGAAMGSGATGRPGWSSLGMLDREEQRRKQ